MLEHIYKNAKSVQSLVENLIVDLFFYSSSTFTTTRRRYHVDLNMFKQMKAAIVLTTSVETQKNGMYCTWLWESCTSDLKGEDQMPQRETDGVEALVFPAGVK